MMSFAPGFANEFSQSIVYDRINELALTSSNERL